ncbi:hypothetical protein JOM56_006385 [Amanita muscaria]
MPPSSKRASAKFYQQDIVQRIAPPLSYGIVLRCWHDAEDLPPNPIDPLMRPLKHGEVGVSFLGDGGERDILLESELRLVDRTLNAGDYCKRNIDDVCSGVVVNFHVLGRVEHAITGEKLDGWWTTNDLWNKTDADVGDYVIYDDWIGQVIEVFDESVVELADGQLVRIPELGSHLHVGERGSDILPPPSGGVQNFIGYLLGGGLSASTPSTVVAVKHSVYAIAWLALNQSLSPAVIENKKRPQRLWTREDISKLTLIHGRADKELRVGDRANFKDPVGKPSSTHSQGGEGSSVITVQTFVVTETETTLDVLWQDGSRETLRSTDLIPYINPDEYDCWPGDHVLWKNEEEKQAAIVQSVNATDRTALILLADTRTLETVSVLELDPHGAYEQNGATAQSITDGFGMHRSDFVFIHPQGATNGFEPPYVPRLGELEAWVGEEPVYDSDFKGWRKEMAEMGSKIADQRIHRAPVNESVSLPQPRDATLHWIGEVTELNLDGTVEVTHPDLSVKTYPLERLTRLYDGMEQLEDQAWGDDAFEGRDSENEEVWAMNDDGKWQPEDNHDPDWEDEDDIDDAMDIDEWKVQNDEELAERDYQQIAPQPVAQSVQTGSSSKEVAISRDGLQPTPSGVDGLAIPSTSNDGGSWKRFDVLSSAPIDHAFYSTTPAIPPKSFLSRLNREYRVLASSLPDSILVRAYEDRTDLLRSLIIGPENTPYEDAPFVIDWMLDSNFPHSPPVAHFLSWTNGNGRVNPNLYEEGKVCLSILGTWAGDRNEMWSATRSSLLQALVSIQGLVLVKEPWFCEPAYEKLRGTEEGIVNSRLYSEKAYVLSRGFVRRALEIPLGGLESEITWLYYTQGRLEKVLNDARRLIGESKNTPEAEGDSGLAVPRLTTGGIIMLDRTLTKLQGLLDSHRNN